MLSGVWCRKLLQHHCLLQCAAMLAVAATYELAHVGASEESQHALPWFTPAQGEVPQQGVSPSMGVMTGCDTLGQSISSVIAVQL